MTPPKNIDTRQVATRVSSGTWELLQVAMLVEGAETMQDLLCPVVEGYARRLAEAPEVKAILESSRAYRDRKQGVTRLKRPRRSSAGSASAADEPS
jgi:hypothetical protein